MGWAPRTAVCEAVRAWIVLPQAKVVLLNVCALANHARGTCPAAHRRCRRSTTRAACCPEPPNDDDVGFKQDGVGGREQREQGRLAPEATGRDPQRDRGASKQGLTESLRRRHVPVTARHGGNADPGEGDLAPGDGHRGSGCIIGSDEDALFSLGMPSRPPPDANCDHDPEYRRARRPLT